jgi:hypothetical protein
MLMSLLAVKSEAGVGAKILEKMRAVQTRMEKHTVHKIGNIKVIAPVPLALFGVV